jgi:hypothetical protein
MAFTRSSKNTHPARKSAFGLACALASALLAQACLSPSVVQNSLDEDPARPRALVSPSPTVTVTASPSPSPSPSPSASPSPSPSPSASASPSPSPSPSPIPTNGLVAHWKFDETSGTTIADSSANNLTGSVLGAPTRGPGAVGNAFNFDGVDDAVDLGNPAKLQITGAMSISVWVYIKSFTVAGRIISKQGGASNRGWSLGIETSGVAAFQVAVDASTLVSVSTDLLPTNQWIHLTGVYAPGTALRIFVDGSLARANTTGIPAAQYDSSLEVNIGRRPTNSLYFDGRIDALRVYSRVLTGAEVRTISQE